MKEEVISHLEPKSPISEVFRALRTNLQFMYKLDTCQTILITSTVQSEGKSLVASNLATTFAQAGKRTLLIDSDMRRPRQYTIFSTKSSPGLSNYLSNIISNEKKDNLSAAECIVKTEIENLSLLPAGDIPPNPSELLLSSRIEELIKEVSENFDTVIFDGAPCLLVTDSVILSRLVSQTLLVTSYKNTKKDDLREVKKRIDNIGGNIVGVVLNKVEISAKKYDSKYYYYSNTAKEEIVEDNKISMKTNIKDAEKNIENTKNEIEKEQQENKENSIEMIDNENDISDKTKEILADIEKFEE